MARPGEPAVLLEEAADRGARAGIARAQRGSASPGVAISTMRGAAVEARRQ